MLAQAIDRSRRVLHFDAVRVNHRGSHILVAEPSLNLGDAAAHFQQMRGVTVTKAVRMHLLRDSRRPPSLRQRRLKPGRKQVVPRLDTARRLADLLDWPRLTEIIVASRTYTCVVCPRTFVYDGMGPRRYCSSACQTVVDKMRLGRPVRVMAVRAERALALHATAVAAFCKTCEPDGQCKTRDCELRSVSPLPLVFA